MPYKVLLVDDEPAILGLVLATLSIDDRYEILTAGDGDMALEVCKEHRPDLVYLDMLMPRKDGITVCQELRSDPELRSTRIVMVTAMSQESDRAKATFAGADGYITKPFSPKALLEKTEEMLFGGGVAAH